ncbi:hypothetical protein [Arthrobacter sp. GMC3]|uniref:hypothetical protein n=1 Tax=Arthrobacter sp. GMC3 TaxID=2058894 RepID=UPI000CE33133|nr:hypothetical protein [Arthrobacter sp. GMC3]
MAEPITPTTTLKDYIGADARDTTFIAECDAEAQELVDERCKGSRVPPLTKRRAVLEVGAELYKRRATQNGTPAMDSPEMTPQRARNDPMKAAKFILDPFLEPGIG